MVALALVRIGDREVGNGLVEFVAVTEIAGNPGRLGATRISSRQRPSAQFGILCHDAAGEQLDQHFDLHVFKLAYIEVPARRLDSPA